MIDLTQLPQPACLGRRISAAIFSRFAAGDFQGIHTAIGYQHMVD